MYVGIDGLDPLTDFHEIFAVDGITVIAAESDLAYAPYRIGTYLILEKFQCQLAVEQGIWDLCTRASRTAQGADAGWFDVPMV